MRLRAWTVRAGPVVVATALLPTLLGALVAVAPRATGIGGAASVQGPSHERAASKRHVPNGAAITETPLPPLPCTPLRGADNVGAEAVPVRVEALLTDRGEQIGQRISLRARRGTEVTISLPAESFVSQAAGDWLVYGSAGRRESAIGAIDLETGCDTSLARVAGVARSGVLDRSGAALYVHTVDSGSRRDGGVTRIDLKSGDQREAVPPFRADEDFGRVFATTLAWSLDASSLAVQSCGAIECQTRLLDTSSGEIEAYRDGHGALVGVTEQAVIVFAAGHERPAAVLAIARGIGTATVIADDAYDAELAGDAQAPLVRIETAAGWREMKP